MFGSTGDCKTEGGFREGEGAAPLDSRGHVSTHQFRRTTYSGRFRGSELSEPAEFPSVRLSVFVSQTAGLMGERERPTTDEDQSGTSLPASSGYSRAARPQHLQVTVRPRSAGLDAS